MKVDPRVYRIVNAYSETVALRTAAQAWIDACNADGLDHTSGCKHERATAKAHRKFLEATIPFVHMLRGVNEALPRWEAGWTDAMRAEYWIKYTEDK